MVYWDEQVAIAFGMVLLAGLASCAGGAAIFSDKLLKYTGKTFLSGSMGLSAGVMLFVSFVEIFHESKEKFEDSGSSPSASAAFTTLSFFGGFCSLWALNALVHLIDPHHTHDPPPQPCAQAAEADFGQAEITKGTTRNHTASIDDEKTSSTGTVLKKKDSLRSNSVFQAVEEALTPLYLSATSPSLRSPTVIMSRQTCSSSMERIIQEDGVRLHRAGLLTALAIGIHNFPEGIVTFVSALDNVAVGGAVALAIALHNIPEGLAVAVPVYFATGSRRRAFLWASAAAAAGPFGALIAWLAIGKSLSNVAFGVIFGMVAGMMVCVTVTQLFPVAWFHDPTDRHVSKCVAFGMAIMASSLVAFDFFG